jgi:glycerophosphoryl diester phosphodiesterase
MASFDVSRRGFLIAAVSTALLTGCSGTPSTTLPTPVEPAAPSPTPSRPPSPTPSRPPAPADIRELVSRSRFFVAHRGSGDNWPEHTLTAYRNAILAGADAIEVSVCATSDGVLICHHDLSGTRVLGVDKKIADMTWAEVSGLQVDARSWLGPDTPLVPVTRLEDALREIGEDVLVFIEDKQGTNTRALLDMLDAQTRSTERFVWKQWAPAKQVGAAKERGYAAWGYFDEEQIDRLAEFAATFDILGVPTSTPDATISKVVAAGRPLMCWEVRFHDQVERLAGLGVTGLMCSNVGYLVNAQPAERDHFATGRRAPGDLPAEIDTLGWSSQPAIVPSRQSLRIERADATSYLMGSLAAPGKRLSRLDVTIVWPDAVPPTGAVGVLFGLTGDAPGGAGQRGTADGYQLSMHADGALSLARAAQGVTGSALASTRGETPTAGVPVRLQIDVDEGGVRVASDSGRELAAEFDDPAELGPWIRLFKDYPTNQAVEFSDVRVGWVHPAQ